METVPLGTPPGIAEARFGIERQKGYDLQRRNRAGTIRVRGLSGIALDCFRRAVIPIETAVGGLAQK